MGDDASFDEPASSLGFRFPKERQKLRGQVIGKALQECDGNGIGKIKALVNVK